MKVITSSIFLILFLLFFSGKEAEPTYPLYYQKASEAIARYNYPAALYYLDSAMVLGAANDSTYSLMAFCYQSLGKPDKAIAYCNKSLAENPNSYYAYHVRGMAVASTDLFNDSIFTDSLTSVLKKHKKDSLWMAKNFNNRYYFPQGGNGLYDYGKAIADISKSIELKPNYTSGYLWRAYYYYWLNQYEPAEKDYTKCIELEPENAWNYLNRGRFYERFGPPGKSRDDYSKGIKLNPELGELYERRGYLYRDVFYDKEYACQDFRKATLLGRYIEDMDEYCKPNWLDTLLHSKYDYPMWRHDFNNCYCPNMEDMFDPATDTIKEIELVPGHKQKMLDIKDSEKTTWQFEDGSIIEISKKTKERWLKEEEERKKKLPKL